MNTNNLPMIVFNGYLINLKEVSNGFIVDNVKPDGKPIKWLKLNFVNTQYVTIELTKDQMHYTMADIWKLFLYQLG